MGISLEKDTIDYWGLSELSNEESVKLFGGETFGYRVGQALGYTWNGIKAIHNFFKEHSDQDMGIVISP